MISLRVFALHLFFLDQGSDSVVERVNSSLPLRKDLVVEVLTVGSLYPPQVNTLSTKSCIQFFALVYFLYSQI